MENAIEQPNFFEVKKERLRKAAIRRALTSLKKHGIIKEDSVDLGLSVIDRAYISFFVDVNLIQRKKKVYIKKSKASS